MILYFEIHYQDDCNYTIENLGNSNKKLVDGEFMAQRLNEVGTYAYSVIVDTDKFTSDFKYGMAQIVSDVVNKMSRGKKLKRILNEIQKG